MRSGEFYSKGKLLLSGEYFVLYGAKALAVPLKFGQRMLINEIRQTGILEWKTTVLGKLWFNARFSLKDLAILDASDQITALFIRNLLIEASKLQPKLQQSAGGFSIGNFIDFDLRWGLGSSSSLVSNIAYWLDIDPFDLYKTTFRGSGYDVFCARANQAITYQLKDDQRVIHEIPFKPSFSEHIYFVYLGRKQDSQESVRKFRSQSIRDDQLIHKISELTDVIIKAADLENFLSAIRKLEEITSAAIGLPAVKQEMFSDFDGEIKSLGAWGGDFVMAGTKLNREEVRKYFAGKDLPVIFGWDDIIY